MINSSCEIFLAFVSKFLIKVIIKIRHPLDEILALRQVVEINVCVFQLVGEFFIFVPYSSHVTDVFANLS